MHDGEDLKHPLKTVWAVIITLLRERKMGPTCWPTTALAMETILGTRWKDIHAYTNTIMLFDHVV